MGVRVEAWEEEDGWRIRVRGEPKGQLKEPFDSARAARLVYRSAMRQLTEAPFVVLPSPPADLDD